MAHLYIVYLLEMVDLSMAMLVYQRVSSSRNHPISIIISTDESSNDVQIVQPSFFYPHQSIQLGGSYPPIYVVISVS